MIIRCNRKVKYYTNYHKINKNAGFELTANISDKFELELLWVVGVTKKNLVTARR